MRDNLTLAQSWDKLVAMSASVLAEQHHPESIANTYLHPLNAHPNVLARYAALFEGRPAHATRLYNAAAGLAIELKALAQPTDLFDGDELPKQVDILFLSHFLRSSQAHDLSDLYFGTLPQWLAQRRVSSVTALINHSRQSWDKLSRDWVSGDVRRVLLSRNTDLRTERKIASRLAVAAKRLAQTRAPQASNFDRQFLAHAAANANSPGSRTALRIAGQVRELVRRLKPRMLVTTYEGHSWERLAFHAARLANPEIICVGYHHALLFPFTNAMARRLGRSYDPDHILTAGDNTTDWLSNQVGVQDIPTATMGSVRAPATAISPERVEGHRTCLVIPEGTVLETLKLAELAAQAGRQAPGVTFRIRLHPVLSLERLLREHTSLRSLPSNVTWSKASLDDDLCISRWALYRGTTAVIASILAGLKPFYYDDGGINIDPLNAMPVWRHTVAKAGDLVRSVEVDLATSAAIRRADCETAVAYCRKCFSTFDPSVLMTILSTKAPR